MVGVPAPGVEAAAVVKAQSEALAAREVRPGSGTADSLAAVEGSGAAAEEEDAAGAEESRVAAGRFRERGTEVTDGLMATTCAGRGVSAR